MLSVLLLSARTYSMKNEDGRVNEGVSIHYTIPGSNDGSDASVLGEAPCKGSLPLASWEEIRANGVHRMYDVKFQTVIKAGVPNLKLLGIKAHKA